MDKKKLSLRLTALVAIAAIIMTFAGCGGKKVEIKNSETYASEIQALNIFSNDTDKAFPQTIIHKIIMDHFDAPLAKGKKVKKAIFLGYDGMRADGLENVKDLKNGGVMHIAKEGGLYNSFSGGISGVNEQATSTSPSWMAMLTGGWGDYNGIKDNSQQKNPDADTFLTKLAKRGMTGSFTTSWREHTALSYRPDIVASIENGLQVDYTHQPDDAGTYYQVLKYVSKPDGVKKSAAADPDMIFFTFEHPDHAGHNSGFGNGNQNYIDACVEADTWGYEIIKTIENRSTYDKEDWLIIIGTDHGGTNYSHGGQTPFERMTWFACNKKVDVSDENLSFQIKK